MARRDRLLIPVISTEWNKGQTFEIVDGAYREILEAIPHSLYVLYLFGGNLYGTVVPQLSGIGRIEDLVITSHFESVQRGIGGKAVLHIVDM